MESIWALIVILVGAILGVVTPVLIIEYRKETRHGSYTPKTVARTNGERKGNT